MTAATVRQAGRLTVARSLDELADVRDAWSRLRLQGNQINTATAKGIRTNLARTGVLALIGAAKRAAETRQLGNALENRWRARLRADAS